MEHRLDNNGQKFAGTGPTDAFSYAELEILCGTGHSDAIGMSAIDGLIATSGAGPSFVHPDEWIP